MASALGLWSEKTRVGKELSGALVATLIGLALSNLGVIPCDALEYDIVNKYLLPLAVPMLLLSADLRKVVRDTGRLLPVFLAGSVTTVLGTLAAISVFTLASLGENGWKIAAALCARHIGGAINYVAVTVATGADQAAVSAGLAADNLICAVYFTSLYALARGIPPDSDDAAAPDGTQAEIKDETQQSMNVLHGCTALAIASVICHLAHVASGRVGQPGMVIPIITGLTVTLATAVPRLLAPIVPSAEGLAAILMQVFFASVGANGSVAQVMHNAPSLFVFSFIQVFVHLGLLLGIGKACRWRRRDVLLASNANVGGPTTAAGMAAAKGWKLSLVPSLLIGTLGYAIATFVAIGLGPTLRRMSLGAA